MLNNVALASRLKTSELVSVYNLYSDKPVKKFADRKTAVQRTADVLELKGVKNTKEINKVISDESKGLIKDLPEKRKAKFPGPVSVYEGKKIYKKVKSNPRRKDTHGWHSFNLVKDGMTFEQYRLAGGRTVDLRWDINKKFVEVR